MQQPCAQRTLVKSPPELWAEVSDASALARHLGAFGEIRIIRLEPETTVAWEGDRACGTVELEPAGWGTKVTLTAEVAGPASAAAEPTPVVEPIGEQTVSADPDPRPGLFARLFSRRRRAVDAVVEREPEPVAEPGPEPSAGDPPPDAQRTREILGTVLDDLGAAHHRPFSR